MMEETKTADRYVPYKKRLALHDEAIKASYSDRRTGDIAEECGMNYYTVSRRAARLGVRKSDAFMRSSWSKSGPSRSGRKYAEVRKKADPYLKEHFSDTSNEDLSKVLGVDTKTIRRWARRLGLQKSEAFMFQARSRGRAGKSYYTPEQIAWRDKRIAEVLPDADMDTIDRLAAELGVGRSYLYALASRIGVHRSPERVHEDRCRPKKKRYGQEFVAAVTTYYGDHTLEECAGHFGVSANVIKGISIRYGLRKGKEHLSRVRSMVSHKKKNDR